MGNKSKDPKEKPDLSQKTISYYYKHKFLHVSFVLSIAAMYAVGNYYNYFMNVTKPEDPI